MAATPINGAEGASHPAKTTEALLGVLPGQPGGRSQAPLSLALRWVFTLGPKRGISVTMCNSSLPLGRAGAARIPADQGADSKAHGLGMDFTLGVSK